ncbi:hypothetical protein ANN_00066 [Periplaneta americana]|uniref:Uncharacterized protein n=1 Tax=Periplaneta americana TaxID=6978 RepID=A0ABQ8TPQ4_PERAM|nr:hypothetical protein ANN_00066 [Periplaneta americana]
MNERLLIGAPKESKGEAQSNGWTTSQLMQHFAHYDKSFCSEPRFVNFRWPCQHKDLEVITYARNQNIHI